MKKMVHVILSLVLTVCSVPTIAQQSDNGDGTFTNPVLWADLPDPDVIQVEISPLFNRHVAAGTTPIKSVK